MYYISDVNGDFPSTVVLFCFMRINGKPLPMLKYKQRLDCQSHCRRTKFYQLWCRADRNMMSLGQSLHSSLCSMDDDDNLWPIWPLRTTCMTEFPISQKLTLAKCWLSDEMLQPILHVRCDIACCLRSYTRCFSKAMWLPKGFGDGYASLVTEGQANPVSSYYWAFIEKWTSIQLGLQLTHRIDVTLTSDVNLQSTAPVGLYVGTPSQLGSQMILQSHPSNWSSDWSF